MSYILYLATECVIELDKLNEKTPMFKLILSNLPNHAFGISKTDFSFDYIFQVITERCSGDEFRGWNREIGFCEPLEWASENINSDEYIRTMKLYDFILDINKRGISVELMMKWWNEPIENDAFENFDLASISKSRFTLFTNYKIRFKTKKQTEYTPVAKTP